MTIRQAILYGTDKINEFNIENPTLDTIILLCHTLNISKELLFARYPDPLTQEELDRFKDLIKKRTEHWPIAYITGKKEFYDLDFFVNQSTLIPRPDTEILVEKALEILEDNPTLKTVHDLCTGTGCIAISMKKNNKNIEISASDISEKAKEVFKQNLNLHNINMDFYLSDILDGIDKKFDMIVSNPPYVKNGEVDTMIKEGSKEPELALRSGDNGLVFPIKLIKKCLAYLNPGAYLIIEAGFDQLEILEKTMKDNGYSNVEITKDLGDRNRVISGRFK